MKNKSTSQRSWVRILFVVIIIIVFLWLFDLELILQAIRSADWALLGTAAIVLLLGYAVEAARLRYLFSNLPSFKSTYHVKDVSNMMNLVMLIPVTLIRIFLMSQDKSVSPARAVSSSSLAIVFDWILKIVSILGVVLIIVRERYLEDFLLLFLLILAGLIGGIMYLVGNADKIVISMTPRLSRLPFLTEEQSTTISDRACSGLASHWFPAQVAWRLGLDFPDLGCRPALLCPGHAGL